MSMIGKFLWNWKLGLRKYGIPMHGLGLPQCAFPRPKIDLSEYGELSGTVLTFASYSELGDLIEDLESIR